MKNHRKAAVAAIVGMLLAATFTGSSARADTAEASCLASCRQVRRAGNLTCLRDTNCGMEFRVCRQDCNAALDPGPQRQECVRMFCLQALNNCKSEMVSCKAMCSDKFLTCKNDCVTTN